mgnify:CR=1 FL=1
MNNLSKFTKTFLAVGLIFVIYGYLSRLVGLYFFWESKSIGWAIIFIGLIGLLLDRIKIKKEKEKKSILEKIGIGVIAFILLIQTILIAVIPFTDAYSVAKEYIKNNEQLTDEIGTVNGFGLIPTGGIQKTTDSQGTYGSATINLTIKGKKKYKDVTVYVVKYADQPEWTVEQID